MGGNVVVTMATPIAFPALIMMMMMMLLLASHIVQSVSICSTNNILLLFAIKKRTENSCFIFHWTQINANYPDLCMINSNETTSKVHGTLTTKTHFRWPNMIRAKGQKMCSETGLLWVNRSLIINQTCHLEYFGVSKFFVLKKCFPHSVLLYFQTALIYEIMK